MTGSRSRFIQWCRDNDYPVGIRSDDSFVGSTEVRWQGWQAGHADGQRETARRCAQVAGPEDSYQDEHFKAKADSVARIRKEFPGAWE